jgi:hypothetical protein
MKKISKQMRMILMQICTREKVIKVFIFSLIPAFIFYIVALFGLKYLGFSTMEVLRDPSQQSGASSLLGFLSNIGIWMWVSAAAICFFSIITRWKLMLKKKKELLLLTGLLSLMLASDDMFLIHDRFIDQRICYAVYAILALVLLSRHYIMIFEVEGFAFLMAGFLLFMSILSDYTQNYNPIGYRIVQIFEEGFKFTGAVTWLYFNSRIASAGTYFNDVESESIMLLEQKTPEIHHLEEN